MPGLWALRRLVPYYKPYHNALLLGLLLVILSSAARRSSLAHPDGDRRLGSPDTVTPIRGWPPGSWVPQSWPAPSLRHARAVMASAGGIETDLRATCSVTSPLDGATTPHRTGDLMARLTTPERVAWRGPAVMYLVNTIAGAAAALFFMLRIDDTLTLLALLPMIALPVLMLRLGTEIHSRFESVQEHFGTVTTLVQENLAGVRVVRAYRQEDAEVSRFDTPQRGVLQRNLAPREALRHHESGLRPPSRPRTVVVLGFGGLMALRGHHHRGAFVAFGFYWPCSPGRSSRSAG